MSKSLSTSETKTLAAEMCRKNGNRNRFFLSALLTLVSSSAVSVVISLILWAIASGLIADLLVSFAYSFSDSPAMLYSYFLRDGKTFVITILAAVAIFAVIYAVQGVAMVFSTGDAAVYNDASKSGNATLNSYKKLGNNFGQKILLSILQVLLVNWPIAAAIVLTLAFARNKFSVLTRFSNEYVLTTVLGSVLAMFFALFLIAVVVGIVLSFRYSQAFFIINNEKDISAVDALRKSAELMKGNKFNLFKLYLSFWWMFLIAFAIFMFAEIIDSEAGFSVFSLIGYAYMYYFIIPHLMSAICIFYHDINGDADSILHNFTQPAAETESSASQGSTEQYQDTAYNNAQGFADNNASYDNNPTQQNEGQEEQHHYDSGEEIRSEHGIDGEASEDVNSNNGIEGEVKE